jgi:lysophospholipase L1-like esterase
MGNRARTAVLALVAPILALAMVEGSVSLGRFAWLALEAVDPLRHARYDPDLGWSHVPGFSAGDYWGPGRPLRINRQGFRGPHDVPASPPAGKVRLVCSGDSFTFGYGVGDLETWCAQLERIDPRLETINMGQSGYGIDQAYLWYRRDGAPLAPSVHAFAFIYDDFIRVIRDRDGKPVIRVVDGKLRVENVPVPRGHNPFPWLQRHSRVLDELRSVTLLRRAVGSVLERSGPPWTLGEGARISFRILSRLASRHARKGAVLVLVYLPTREDLSSSTFDELRAWLAEQAEKQQIAYVDLTADMRALAPERAQELFLRNDEVPQGGGGHYNEAGNRFVATHLHARLEALPAVAALLASAEGGAHARREAGASQQP